MERLIDADPQVVWSVIAEPAMQERIDPRCRVEFVSGGAGEMSSEYVLAFRSGSLGVTRLRYVVVDAEPGVRWVAAVERGGKAHGEQRAELSTSPNGTLLRWTVTMWAGALNRPLFTATCRRALPKWLAALEREAVLAGY